MASAIDPTKPEDGVPAVKADLRANLQAAKAEIEELQVASAAGVSSNGNPAIAVNAGSFGDSEFIKILCTASSAIAVTLANDVPAGRVVELVRYGTGDITVQEGAGASLVKPTSASHATTEQYEALIYEVDTNVAAVAGLDAAQSWDSNNQTYVVSAGSDRLLVVGVQHEGDITPDSVNVTYGEQPMTRQVFEHVEAAGTDNEVLLFTIDEAGIQAASSPTIAVTGAAAALTLHATSYRAVDQATPITGTNSAETDAATPNPLLTSINTAAGTAVVALAGVGQAAVADWTSSNLTERTDRTSGGTTAGSLAHGFFAIGQAVTAGCLWDSQNRAVVCAMELAPSAVGGASENAVWRLVARP